MAMKLSIQLIPAINVIAFLASKIEADVCTKGDVDELFEDDVTLCKRL